MKRPGDKLTLQDLFDNPSDDFILDDLGLDPEADLPLPWWARPLTQDDRDEIAKNQEPRP